MRCHPSLCQVEAVVEHRTVRQAAAAPHVSPPATGVAHGRVAGAVTGRGRIVARAVALPADAFRLSRFDGWNGPTPALSPHG